MDKLREQFSQIPWASFGRPTPVSALARRNDLFATHDAVVGVENSAMQRFVPLARREEFLRNDL